ncbi:MAG: cytochrome c [Desulfobacterales bacterium]|nr:cytochrome c [Desulfobacterales bacterium]
MKKGIALLLSVVVVVLVVYHVLIYYDNYFPHGRMRETPAVRPHEEPLLIMEAGIIPFSGGEVVYRQTPDAELRAPFTLATPANIELGKAGYFTYCAQCHGIHHDGKGTVGQSFKPLPTNLRTEAVQSQSEGTLFKHISYGVSDGRQPALATTIDVPTRWRIVAYVKSLGAP